MSLTKDICNIKKDYKLRIFSNEKNYLPVMEFIYKKNNNLQNIRYIDNIIFRKRQFIHRKDTFKRKIIIPDVIDNSLEYNKTTIFFKHNLLKSNLNSAEKLLEVKGCGSSQEMLLYEVILKSGNNQILIDFIDEALKVYENESQNHLCNVNEHTRIYWYNDYWSLYSKIPIRRYQSLFLKENQYNNLVEDITNFLSPDSRKDYLHYGIPYKRVYLLHGLPGTGKTSTINTIASSINSDIYIIPLSNEMTDSNFIEAISSMSREFNENNDNPKIIVIEDIDCIFEDRKDGDVLKSKISLHTLLNSFDGFTCSDGTILFITANNINTFDSALIRSGRIDISIQYTYADKYQTYNILEHYLPNKKHIHDKIYKSIEHKNYSIAMLQEFLFKYRKSSNIIEHLNDLINIVDKQIQSEGNNIYM